MNWPAVRFEDIHLEPSRNGVYKRGPFHGSGVRIVNMGELFSYDTIDDQSMNRIMMTDSEMDRFGLANGDLLFARRSLVDAGAGKCSIVGNLSEPTTFESSIIRIRIDQTLIQPRFLYYWLKSHFGRSEIRAIVTGTNIKGIRGNTLKNIKIPCPSIEVQNSIVIKLKNYDDLIKNNRRRIQLLERAARLLYREWFVHLRFPGHEHIRMKNDFPDGWESKMLGEIANITMGQSPKSVHYNKNGVGLPFHQGVTNFGERFPSHQIYCTSPSRLAESNDILFSVRAPVGRINVTPDKIVIGRGIAAIRSNQDQQNFLFYTLKNHFFKEDLIGGGTIFSAVTKKDLYRVELMQPPDVIVNMFTRFVNPIDQQISILQRIIDRLGQSRDEILPRLMNGEMTV